MSKKFLDLFAGIGGFNQGLKDLGYKHVNIVGEIDEHCKQTYSENYSEGQRIEFTDVSEIHKNNMTDEEINKKYPDVDLITGGFPCQSFSSAGNKKGFKDETKGTLFFDLARIVEVKKPKYFMFENVKHIVRHDNGNTWKVIMETIKELGYITTKEPLIVSPRDFGLLQNRERVFMLGVRKDLLPDNTEWLPYDTDFKKEEDKGLEKIENILEKHVDSKYIVNEKLNIALSAWGELIRQVKLIEGKTIPVLWLHSIFSNEDTTNYPSWKIKYIEQMKEFYEYNKEVFDAWMDKYHPLENWKIRETKLEWQAGKDNNEIKNTLIQFRQSGIRCKKIDKFPTLVAMVQIPCLYDYENNHFRYLTPRETARLQGFPEDFIIDKFDHQAYKQFGNAVHVKVVHKVMKRLLESI
ncbi:MAG: DNA (cytosine-5-)-methyltransferase [Mycoplasmataceae bacterium]|nr:DNA (cytosine-5-)-methyltransferase [Mycoplasmataceae bacterium]